MTWEIFLGIAALVAFIISIGKIISNNTKAMTEVKVGLDGLRDALGEQKKKINGIETTVNAHETRITVLERKK